MGELDKGNYVLVVVIVVIVVVVFTLVVWWCLIVDYLVWSWAIVFSSSWAFGGDVRCIHIAECLQNKVGVLFFTHFPIKSKTLLVCVSFSLIRSNSILYHFYFIFSCYFYQFMQILMFVFLYFFERCCCLNDCAIIR